MPYPDVEIVSESAAQTQPASTSAARVTDVDKPGPSRRPFARGNKSGRRSRQLEQNGKPLTSDAQARAHSPSAAQAAPSQRRRNSASNECTSDVDDGNAPHDEGPGIKRPRLSSNVQYVDGPRTSARRRTPVKPSAPARRRVVSVAPKNVTDVIEVEESPAKQVEELSTSTVPQSTRSSARIRSRESPSTYNRTQTRNDRQRRERIVSKCEEDAPARPNPQCRLKPTLQRGAIDVDHDLDDISDTDMAPLAPKHAKESKPVTAEKPIEVDLVQKELEEEVKALAAVDAPYDGPTELIFEFPPGKRGKIRVTAEERERLLQRKYLNDSLLDFYIKYTEEKLLDRDPQFGVQAKFFSTFFFGRLRRESGADCRGSSTPIDYSGVKGWTKGEDIFAMKYVFVPVCDSFHWSLIIVANLDKMEAALKEQGTLPPKDSPKIIYLDSLDPKRGTIFGEIMRHYLVYEWVNRKQGKAASDGLRRVTYQRFKKAMGGIMKPNVPVQTNEYDCGLYVLNSLNMFLSNEGRARDKLLSGEKDLQNLYSQCEIKTLHRDIGGLIWMLENDWKQKYPVNESSTERIAKESKQESANEREEIEPTDPRTERPVADSVPPAEALVGEDESNGSERGQLPRDLPAVEATSEVDDGEEGRTEGVGLEDMEEEACSQFQARDGEAVAHSEGMCVDDDNDEDEDRDQDEDRDEDSGANKDVDVSMDEDGDENMSPVRQGLRPDVNMKEAELESGAMCGYLSRHPPDQQKGVDIAPSSPGVYAEHDIEATTLPARHDATAASKEAAASAVMLGGGGSHMQDEEPSAMHDAQFEQDDDDVGLRSPMEEEDADICVDERVSSPGKYPTLQNRPYMEISGIGVDRSSASLQKPIPRKYANFEIPEQLSSPEGSHGHLQPGGSKHENGHDQSEYLLEIDNPSGGKG